MLHEISEQDFLSLKETPIQYLGLYDPLLPLDENLIDCEGIILAFDDRKVLVKSKGSDELPGDFCYYDFPLNYDCRKVVSTQAVALRFIRKEVGGEFDRVLRFQSGVRPILVTAGEGMLTVGISHWDVHGMWMEFEDNRLLNDG